MEVALALMVVSIGVMSLVGLMPASLDMSKKAIDDSQLGLFGDNVMNGYRSLVQIKPWGQWSGLVVPSTSKDVWDPGKRVDINIGSGTNVYQYTSVQPAGGPSEIVDLATHYKFNVQSIFGGKMLSCRLELTPGEYGTNNPIVFYTEIYSNDLTW